MIYAALSGIIIMGCWIAGLFFLKFWRKSRERLFLFFAMAFWLLGCERIIPIAIADPRTEPHTFIYLIRLVAFALILYAIIDKNRSRPIAFKNRGD